MKKSDIVSVVPSNTTVDKLVIALSKSDFITVDSGFLGRKFYSIRLTDKGRSVAEQLRKAELVAKGETEIQLGSRKPCMNCGTSNEQDAKFCKECGMKLERKVN